MNVYLDNSATTKPCEAAAALAQAYMESGWYNPSALYRPALETEKRISAVREKCLSAAGASGCRIIFTSGGTESDNLAIFGYMRGRRRSGTVLFSSIEHPAVSACAEELQRMGHRTAEIPVNGSGIIDCKKLESMLDSDTAMICVMQVNNETGAIQPVPEIVELRNRLCPEAAIHIDGVQGFLRVPVGFNRLGIQSYAFSAHKIHGLKGTGGLIVSRDFPVHPVVFGGGQEKGFRSGTENTLGILALGAAVDAWNPDDITKMRALKIRLWQKLSEKIPGAVVNGPAPDAAESAPHILNMAFEPVRSQTMLFALEGDGILVSAGSACASRKQKVSPVLKAMNIRTERADCSIRFSLSRETTEEEIDYTAECTAKQYEALKRFTRR